MQYKTITVGGTFDYFHKGHQALIDKALEMGEYVYLGITTDEYFDKGKRQKSPARNCFRKAMQGGKGKSKVNSYIERKQEVEEYLEQKNVSNRVEIVPISDKLGITISNESLQAIVVSPETKKIADEINQLREGKKWQALEIITVPWIYADDHKAINSTRIKNGEISRDGKLYLLPSNWGVQKLPDSLREEFKQPLGEIFKNICDLSHISHIRNDLLISVGDATTEKLLQNHILPDISIIDLKIHRIQVYKNITDLGFSNIKLLKMAKNPPGTLSLTVFQTLNSLIRIEAKPSILQINGEDDLVTLFAGFLAPLNSLIVYGQPDCGMIKIVVTEKIKSKFRKYLEKFVPI